MKGTADLEKHWPADELGKLGYTVKTNSGAVLGAAIQDKSGPIGEVR